LRSSEFQSRLPFDSQHECLYECTRRRCHVTWRTSSVNQSWTTMTTSTMIGLTVNQTTTAVVVVVVEMRHHALTAYLTLTFTASHESLDPPLPAPRRRYDGMLVVRATHRKLKNKLKRGHLYSTYSWELTSKAVRMTRVNERSHSLPRMEWAILPSRSPSPHFGWYSFPVPHRVGGWVGLGRWLHTKMVCPLEDGHSSMESYMLLYRSPWLIPVPTDQ